MKIAVAGASGFVGSRVLRELSRCGFEVVGLLRSQSGIHNVVTAGASAALVDYSSQETLERALAGCDALFHLVGTSSQTLESPFSSSMIQPTRALVAAAEKAGVKMLAYNSGLGTNKGSTQSYFLAKAECERIIQGFMGKNLIFRPSYIIGKGDEFSGLVLERLTKGEEIPVYGSGRYRIQPISVDDVASIYAKSLSLNSVWNRTFDLVGPEVVTFSEFLKTYAEVAGKPLKLKPVNLEFALQDSMRPVNERRYGTELSTDELDVLISDFISSPSELVAAFGVRLTPFRDVLKMILRNN